jgi:hypothetical protein
MTDDGKLGIGSGDPAERLINQARGDLGVGVEAVDRELAVHEPERKLRHQL